MHALFQHKVQNECLRERLGGTRNLWRERPGNCCNQ